MPSDNERNVAARLAKPGPSLPVTGPSTVGVADAGLELVIAGTMAIWSGRRRRLVQPTGSVRAVADEGTS